MSDCFRSGIAAVGHIFVVIGIAGIGVSTRLQHYLPGQVVVDLSVNLGHL